MLTAMKVIAGIVLASLAISAVVAAAMGIYLFVGAVKDRMEFGTGMDVVVLFGFFAIMSIGVGVSSIYGLISLII